MLCQVSLMGYLNRYAKESKEDFELEVDSLETPAAILKFLGIPFSEVEAVFVDGKIGSFSEPLSRAKSIKFLPTVSGG